MTDCSTQLTDLSGKQEPSQSIHRGLRPSTIRVLDLCDSGFAIVVVDSKISSLVKSLAWIIDVFSVMVSRCELSIDILRTIDDGVHCYMHIHIRHISLTVQTSSINFDSRTNSILFYLVPSDEMPLDSNWTNIFSMPVVPFVFTAHGNDNDNKNIWHIFSMTISVWFHLIFNNVVARTYRYLDLNKYLFCAFVFGMKSFQCFLYSAEMSNCQSDVLISIWQLTIDNRKYQFLVSNLKIGIGWLMAMVNSRRPKKATGHTKKIVVDLQFSDTYAQVDTRWIFFGNVFECHSLLRWVRIVIVRNNSNILLIRCVPFRFHSSIYSLIL